jgi:hypothetical protein
MEKIRYIVPNQSMLKDTLFFMICYNHNVEFNIVEYDLIAEMLKNYFMENQSFRELFGPMYNQVFVKYPIHSTSDDPHNRWFDICISNTHGKVLNIKPGPVLHCFVSNKGAHYYITKVTQKY